MCGPLVAQVSSFAAGDEVAAVRVGLLSERRFDILLSRFQLSRTSPERVCLRFREPSMVSPRQVPIAGVVLLQNRRTSLWRRVARFRSLCCESVRRCGCRLRVECGWHRSASQGLGDFQCSGPSVHVGQSGLRFDAVLCLCPSLEEWHCPNSPLADDCLK